MIINNYNIFFCLFFFFPKFQLTSFQSRQYRFSWGWPFLVVWWKKNNKIIGYFDEIKAKIKRENKKQPVYSQ